MYKKVKCFTFIPTFIKVSENFCLYLFSYNLCALIFVLTSFWFIQNALTAHERARVEQMIQEEERLLMEQSELRVDVIDLTRLAQIKVLQIINNNILLNSLAVTY